MEVLEELSILILYVKEDNGTLLENEYDVFKYIPAECDGNVLYSKEPISIDVKPVLTMKKKILVMKFLLHKTNERVLSVLLMKVGKVCLINIKNK